MYKPGDKRKHIEDEMSRFEAEIAVPVNTPAAPPSNMFIPHQVKQPIIGANTYRQVQQKLSSSAPPPPPPVILPPYVPPQMQPQLNYGMQPEKSTYNSQPTPVVLSSAPKLYTNRTPSTLPTPAIDVVTVSYDVSAKLKKLKSSSNNNSSLGSSSAAAAMAGPNPIAEEAIKAARASSALQSFTHEKRSEKGNKGGGAGGAGSGGGGGGANSKKTVRTAGGQVWEDASLADWSDDDYRIFAGDLGNDVNDELLIRTFNKFPSFQRAKVLRDKRTGKSRGFGFISFKEPQDFIKAMKEMDGRYVGSRPIKLRKSNWKSRSFDVVKKKENEKKALLQMFQK